MRNQLTEFADAVNGAACKIFTDYGEAVTALQTVALVAPPARPLAVGLSLAQMAAKQNCEWDTEQPGPTNDVKGGCWKLNGGGVLVAGIGPNGGGRAVAGNCGNPANQFTEITGTNQQEGGAYEVFLKLLNGGSTRAVARGGEKGFYLAPCMPGTTCEEDDPVPPPPAPPTYIHTTEEGCELTVNFQGWGQLPDGSASGIFLIEPAPETRASGGRIGGCNFAPTIVYNPGGGGGDGGGGGGGGGGGPIVVPYPPDPPGPDGKPLWQKLLEAALAGAVSGLVQNLFDETDKKLDQLLECACHEKPELAKHWRSIRFESDEQTPRGNRRLSKLFRYRGVSAGVVDAVADHWKDFRWTTGPACVYHKGSPLGTPKVWAATPAEGQRVIRHAGREAGIDPDQIGEWGVSGSDNPRYGVSLEVGLFCVDGCWSATSRSGPDGYPEAAVAVPDS